MVTDRRQVGDEGVPDSVVVGSVVVVREAISHSFDQRPRHFGMRFGGFGAESGDVLTDLHDQRLRGESRYVVDVSRVPLVTTRDQVGPNAAESNDLSQN